MGSAQSTVDAARSGDEIAFRELVAPFQRELRAHCYFAGIMAFLEPSLFPRLGLAPTLAA